MSFSIENILDKVIFCTRLYPGYPGNMPIKNPKPGGLNTRLIGHLNSHMRNKKIQVKIKFLLGVLILRCRDANGCEVQLIFSNIR